MFFNLLKTNYFNKWYSEQSKSTQNLISTRLDRIAVDGHFGVTNYFDGIIELKWRSGLRLYTTRLDTVIIVILAGRTKHGQSKDIKKAKKILQEIRGGNSNST